MLKSGLIVSCQALEGNPFRDPKLLAVMAKSAEIGGAVAIRANGKEDIREIKAVIGIPIIGLNKQKDLTGRTVITPDFQSAVEIYQAGADIIALDATFVQSDIRDDPASIVRKIHEILNVPVLADISTLAEAEYACSIGADYVSTTLSGYTPLDPFSKNEMYSPNLQLLRSIIDSSAVSCPVIGEGRFWSKEDVTEAIRAGAFAVIIGKAITNPIAITRYFVSGLYTENREVELR